MKITIPGIKILVFALICSMAFPSACKKGKSGEAKPYIYHPTALPGLWSAQPHVDGVDNLLGFNADSTFIISIANYNTGTNRATNWATGKFRAKGDSVSFNITERRTSINNDAPTITTVNETMYDKATYKIKDDQLIITYTSYSSGSPVAATAIYNYLPLAL